MSSKPACIFVRNRATQIKRWKDILEALKDFLIGVVNMDFRSDGIQLLAMDASNTALAYLMLQASGFVEYRCAVRQSVGLKIADLLKAIKAMSSADDMTFSIEEDSLKLSIVGNDAHRHTSIEYALPSLHTESRRFRIPMTEWGRTIQIPTKDFKSYISTLANTGADYLAIDWRDGVLSLSAEEDTISAKISISTVERAVEGEAEQAPKRQRMDDEVPHSPPMVSPSHVLDFNRRFELKYMGYFTKAEPLNAVVRVLLRPDYPLCLTYEITDWGQLTFCLNPSIEEDDEEPAGEFSEF
jgi:proliferating cell nuclear antigen PCNA